MKTSPLRSRHPLISISIGTVFRWTASKNRADLLRFINHLDVDGVEIALGKKEDIFNFSLTKDQIAYLRSLSYVSIHAPFALIRAATDKSEVIAQLDKISEIYYALNAKNIVIHPTDLPDPKVLSRYKCRFSTENLPKKRGFTVKKLQNIFKKYPSVGLCLDVGHAYFWSKDEVDNLIAAFKDRITQIHLHSTYHLDDHQSLSKMSKVYEKSIKNIWTLGVPLIIEQDIQKKNPKALTKEVTLVKQFLAKY